jgi:hypothetical protein
MQFQTSVVVVRIVTFKKIREKKQVYEVNEVHWADCRKKKKWQGKHFIPLIVPFPWNLAPNWIPYRLNAENKTCLHHRLCQIRSKAKYIHEPVSRYYCRPKQIHKRHQVLK